MVKPKTTFCSVFSQIRAKLRKIPPFAVAHTFCASRDGPRESGSLTAVPAKTEIICAVYNCEGKADLGKGYWDRRET